MNGIQESQMSEFAPDVIALIGTGSVKAIQLTQGKVAIVDAEDYERLNQWKWFTEKKTSGFYAARKTLKKNGKHKNSDMCRDILGLLPDDEQIVDHIDRNTLNNRKENLRIADKSLNSHNCKMRKNNKSGYRGVSWHRDARKWQAHFKKNRKGINCGIYVNIFDAAKAYDRMAIKYWGNNATLNFPLKKES